jgi:hypothetical protein
MVWTARYVRERAKVIIERAVLLHHDDDVVNRVDVAVEAKSHCLRYSAGGATNGSIRGVEKEIPG